MRLTCALQLTPCCMFYLLLQESFSSTEDPLQMKETPNVVKLRIHTTRQNLSWICYQCCVLPMQEGRPVLQAQICHVNISCGNTLCSAVVVAVCLLRDHRKLFACITLLVVSEPTAAVGHGGHGILPLPSQPRV